jgi:DNA-binding SARP family transcriptional activator
VQSLMKVPAVGILAMVTTLCFYVVANASGVKQSAVDAISATYSIPIVNSSDGVSLNAVLLIRNALLTTANPDGSGAFAPPGKIYLHLQASSTPTQYPTSSAKWNTFFGQMTPLPASAFSYVTTSGRTYRATRVNSFAAPQYYDATSDNGLVDATYYFMVPISNRTGTILIGPARTVGVESSGLSISALTQLNVGGPSRISVRFPKDLTTITAATVPANLPPGTVAAHLLNDVGLLLTLVLLAYITRVVRRRRRRRAHTPRGDGPEARTVTSPTTVKATRTVVDSSTLDPNAEATTNLLRVGVMGPLRIDHGGDEATDPLRAFVAYLALHDDRPQTADEIQTALWPDDGGRNGVTQKTFLNYVSRARQLVGADHLPESQNGSGYALANAQTDWREFRTLALGADQSPQQEAMVLRQRALRLVRGTPFESDTTSYFEWVTVQKYATNMIESVTKVADQLQSDLVSAGNLDGAEWAIRQAMKLAPTELPLWRALVDICDERGDENVMARFWAEAERALWPKAVDELKARLVG